MAARGQPARRPGANMYGPTHPGARPRPYGQAKVGPHPSTEDARIITHAGNLSMPAATSSCSACGEPARRKCTRCGRVFCNLHIRYGNPHFSLGSLDGGAGYYRNLRARNPDARSGAPLCLLQPHTGQGGTITNGRRTSVLRYAGRGRPPLPD